MTKRIIDHHSSIVIVQSEDEKKFFFNGYDEGYPRPEWRGFLNPLGGNYENRDVSPLSLLEREVNEEMSDEEKKFPTFASNEALVLKNYILRNLQSYQDFVIVDPIIEKNKNCTAEQRSAIVSFYHSIIPISLIEEAAEVLKSGKRLVSEGDGGNVVSMYDILSGKRLMPWSNPFMMKHFLGKEIPYSRLGKAEPIGLPREKLQDYLSDFEYIQPIVQ
jgi:hypothetical protein